MHDRPRDPAAGDGHQQDIRRPQGGQQRVFCAARSERVERALEATQLTQRRRSRAVDLSYAERKFLSIARIMASGARLWLLDEPASGLDRGSYERFVAMLRNEINSGVTICIIE